MSRGCSRFDIDERIRALIGPCISDAMTVIARKILPIIPTPLSIFIGGESGVAKSETALRVHELSGRTGTFVGATFPAETLIGATLFGYRRGAFSGAVEDHDGLLGAARDGTLFLDELADLPKPVQRLLLEFYTRRLYYPVGSTAAETSNCRIIAATNRPLAELAREGTLRRDLLYRVAAFSVDIPPLRERPEDLVPLAKMLLEKMRPEITFGFTPAAIQTLKSQQWLGNIHELKSCMEITVANLVFSGAIETGARAYTISDEELYIGSWANETASGHERNNGSWSTDEMLFLGLAEDCDYNLQAIADRSAKKNGEAKSRAAISAWLKIRPRLKRRFQELKRAHESKHGRRRRLRRKNS